MSIGVMPYRLGLDALVRLRDPDQIPATLDALARKLGSELNQRDDNLRDEIEEGAPTALEGVRLVLADEAPTAPWAGEQMIYGVELLCMYLAHPLRNNAFSPTHWRALGTLDEWLAGAMAPSPLQQLLYRGSPLPLKLPRQVDQPAVGYLRRAEMLEHLARFPSLDRPEAAEHRRELEQLRRWMQTAIDNDHDLIAFTY